MIPEVGKLTLETIQSSSKSECKIQNQTIRSWEKIKIS